MELSQSDIAFRPDLSRQASELHFQKQLEIGLNELKADVTERPLLWLAIAFVAGFVSDTFPVRILFHFVMKLVAWLSGPIILSMGVIKIIDSFASSRRREPTILQRP
jgi:putative Mn2+ efflux pump MntP